MGHLKLDQLIDLAEGSQPESSSPHLMGCSACRRQLADLRATMAAAADVDLPDPSPLFWDHFSARVHEAVADEGAPRRARWLGQWSGGRLAMPLSAVTFAAVVIAAVMTLRVGHGPDVRARPPATFEEVAASEPMTWPEDPSLDLVADLAAEVDADLVVAAGFETHEETSDKAVSQLTAGERSELQRLLKEELARRGA